MSRVSTNPNTPSRIDAPSSCGRDASGTARLSAWRRRLRVQLAHPPTSRPRRWMPSDTRLAPRRKDWQFLALCDGASKAGCVWILPFGLFTGVVGLAKGGPGQGGGSPCWFLDNWFLNGGHRSGSLGPFRAGTAESACTLHVARLHARRQNFPRPPHLHFFFYTFSFSWPGVGLVARRSVTQPGESRNH